MHPILFKIGSLKVFTYGFMLALAFLSAIYLGGREARRTGLSVGRFYDLCFYAIIAAIVGSRLLYVLLEYPYFLSHPLEVFVLWRGGLVFHGGLVASVATALYFAHRFELPWRPTLDAISVGMPMGQFFGRIGCFMAGCCYGRPSNLPWAVTFSDPETLCPLKVPLHPAQLYEALLALGVFGVVYAMRTRKRFEGQLTLTYLCLAGWVRFVVEFFRSPEDYRGPVWFGVMPLTQVIALGLALVAGACLWWLWWRSKTQAAANSK